MQIYRHYDDNFFAYRIHLQSVLKKFALCKYAALTLVFIYNLFIVTLV